jgi:predicted transcriptional regulator of viral defense system
MLAPDSLVAYHTALQFHGIAYSLHFQYVFQSMKKIRNFQFRDDRFKMTAYSKSLPENKRFIFTDKIDHHGFNVRVTQLERTLVDTLDRINLSGGLEEVWRSLNSIQKINVDNVRDYAFLLGNSTTIAKVGFYLRLHQKRWSVSEDYFAAFEKYLPRSVHYLDRRNRINGKYIKEWRIVVPQELIEEGWEEILDIGDV